MVAKSKSKQKHIFSEPTKTKMTRQQAQGERALATASYPNQSPEPAPANVPSVAVLTDMTLDPTVRSDDDPICVDDLICYDVSYEDFVSDPPIALEEGMEIQTTPDDPIRVDAPVEDFVSDPLTSLEDWCLEIQRTLDTALAELDEQFTRMDAILDQLLVQQSQGLVLPLKSAHMNQASRFTTATQRITEVADTGLGRGNCMGVDGLGRGSALDSLGRGTWQEVQFDPRPETGLDDLVATMAEHEAEQYVITSPSQQREQARHPPIRHKNGQDIENDEQLIMPASRHSQKNRRCGICDRDDCASVTQWNTPHPRTRTLCLANDTDRHEECPAGRNSSRSRRTSPTLVEYARKALQKQHQRNIRRYDCAQESTAFEIEVAFSDECARASAIRHKSDLNKGSTLGSGTTCESFLLGTPKRTRSRTFLKLFSDLICRIVSMATLHRHCSFFHLVELPESLFTKSRAGRGVRNSSSVTS